jgi:hypothetical protein
MKSCAITAPRESDSRIKRARAYVAAMETAIAGSGGHNATLHAACVLVKGFNLDENSAMTVLREYNLRCMPPWSERELQHKIKSAAAMPDEKLRGYLLNGDGGLSPSTPRSGDARRQPQKPARYTFDVDALLRLQHPQLDVTPDWLLARSYSDVRYVSAGSFLRAVFQPGERILTFTNERSQGEWGYCVGRGWLKLDGEWGPENSRRHDQTPFRSTGRIVTGEDAGPRSGKLGVWFLSQPVDGMWHWSGENLKQPWTRRSWRSVMEWRHMVLESDDAPTDLYLNWLVQQPLPIAAIYTSAGKSIHALLRFQGVKSKAQWDALRDVLMPYFSKVGVDWRTLTAVRLTRLPCCWREGKMVRSNDDKQSRYVRYPEPLRQRLLYLNALAEPVPIIDLPLQRDVRIFREEGDG